MTRRTPTNRLAINARYEQTPKGRRARARVEAKRNKRRRGPENRRIRLKKLYDLTPANYEALLAKQRGHCALCLCTAADTRFGILYVDHDHRTGQVRGLLCNRHNAGLGSLGDNEEGLLAALNYVRGHR